MKILLAIMVLALCSARLLPREKAPKWAAKAVVGSEFVDVSNLSLTNRFHLMITRGSIW
jgi:hypothetical protein